MSRRVVVESKDGEVNYIALAPKPALRPAARQHMTPAEQARCAFLRWRADVARVEIRRAASQGIYVTESVREFARQVDAYEARAARIEANAATRERRWRQSFVKQATVAIAIVVMLRIAYLWWAA